MQAIHLRNKLKMPYNANELSLDGTCYLTTLQTFYMHTNIYHIEERENPQSIIRPL